MMKAERVREGVKLGLMGHVCDSCRRVPCAVFCRTDSVYLCPGCDARMHVASRHERVWVCEVCEHAPAILTCKADAAALCMSCDADIHSANPLARRHQRIPILPISHGLFGEGREGEEEVEVEEEDGSLLLIDPGRNQNGCEFLCGGEVGDYLDLVEYRPYGEENHYHDGNKKLSQWQEEQNEKKNDGSDCVVPVHGLGIEDDSERQMKKMTQECLELEFESSKGGYSYNTSLSRSVSLSSMDAVVVPDTTMTEISNSHIGSAYLSTGPLQVPPQYSLMDREARVLRYKEKKKNRKFEKTIRYASRKAYAETRPRIKGRFAKRTDVEVELDQIYSANVMAETGYGIVPSF